MHIHVGNDNCISLQVVSLQLSAQCSMPKRKGSVSKRSWTFVATKFISKQCEIWWSTPVAKTLGILEKKWLIWAWKKKDYQKLLAYMCMCRILYSGRLSREKTFTNFTVLWLYAKVFSAKFWAWHPLARQKWAIRRSFLCEIVFFTNSRKFSPSKVPRYTVFKLALLSLRASNCGRYSRVVTI